MMGDECPKRPSPFFKICDDSDSVFKTSVAFSGPSATMTIRTRTSKPLPSEKSPALKNSHDRLLRNFSAGQQSFRWLAFNLESISPLTHWNAMFPNPGLTKIHLTNFNSLSLNEEMVHIFSHCAHRAINYNDFYSIVYWVWVLTHWFAQSVCLLDNICDTGPASLVQT